MVSRSVCVRSSARRSDRVALGVVGIEEAFRRGPLDHLGQLPSQIHRILHTGLKALSAVRGMHVCGIAGQQHPFLAVGRGLPGHVGEPGDRGGTMDSVIASVYGDERLAEIAQGGFGRVSDVLFGHQDADPPPILRFAEGMDAEGVAADAPFRRLPRHLDLGDQVAGCRIPSGEFDGGGFADQTASSIAPDEIFRSQRRSIAELDVDAGVVLRKGRHLTSPVDRHRQLLDPAGEYTLDVVLPQRKRVIVPGGKVADIQWNPGEPSDLHRLPLREEPIGNSSLIEDLDGARVKAAGTRAGEVLAGAPLDNGNVDSRQRRLARQHQAGRARAHDQDIGIPHDHQTAPVVRNRGLHLHRRDEHARVSEAIS
jgi:hypothetical protein